MDQLSEKTDLNTFLQSNQEHIKDWVCSGKLSIKGQLKVIDLIFIDPCWLQLCLEDIMGGQDPYSMSYAVKWVGYSLKKGKMYIEGYWRDEENDPHKKQYYHLIFNPYCSTILENDWAYDSGYNDMAQVVELNMFPSGQIETPSDTVEIYKCLYPKKINSGGF